MGPVQVGMNVVPADAFPIQCVKPQRLLDQALGGRGVPRRPHAVRSASCSQAAEGGAADSGHSGYGFTGRSRTRIGSDDVGQARDRPEAMGEDKTMLL